MNVSAWSIRNPVAAILLFALLTFIGIGGFKSLGIQQFPDIELPIITISMGLAGASPAQLETEILTDGMAIVSVEFTVDKDNGWRVVGLAGDGQQPVDAVGDWLADADGDCDQEFDIAGGLRDVGAA